MKKGVVRGQSPLTRFLPSFGQDQKKVAGRRNLTFANPGKNKELRPGGQNQKETKKYRTPKKGSAFFIS